MRPQDCFLVAFLKLANQSLSGHSPERSVEIQTAIGADIIMQLDDVVDATHPDPRRFEEARHRTVRWLDRCIEAHKRYSTVIIMHPFATQTFRVAHTPLSRPDRQSLFPIVQGGLDEEKRKDCAKELIKRDVPGFAIGGLSGGEEKSLFWRMVPHGVACVLVIRLSCHCPACQVSVSTDVLPRNKPRYLMGVGFAVDLVVCSALGVDMYDCVFPTRTARFKSALIGKAPGSINLKTQVFRTDFRPIEGMTF